MLFVVAIIGVFVLYWTIRMAIYDGLKDVEKWKLRQIAEAREQVRADD